MYQATLELLYVELGVTMELHRIPYRQMAELATDSLVKSSWFFLHTNGIRLKHDIKITGQRRGDKPIMEVFLAHSLPIDTLAALIRCRLFLQAFFISDIADGSGMFITEDAWNGRNNGIAFKNESWPHQGCPTRADWSAWRENVKKYILGRGRQLRVTLGSWLAFDPHWPWYFAPSDGRLYKLSDQGWHSYNPINNRAINSIFSGEGHRTLQVPVLSRATVYQRGSNWVCSGFGDVEINTVKTHGSLAEQILTLPEEEKWCFDSVLMTDDGQTIVTAIREGTAIAVSDGSYKDQYGMAALVIEGSYQQGRILGKVIAPGGPEAHSPYRSELAGIYATMVAVHNICSFYKITEGNIEFACDGFSALDKAFSYVSMISVDEPSYDMLLAIRQQWAYSPILWKIRHVEGHQDDMQSVESLDRWGKLNVEMDKAAKAT